METSNRAWWHQYRKRIHRIPKKNPVEKLLRSSLADTCKEYIQNCSLPGLRFFIDPDVGYAERCYWVVVLLSVSGLLCFSLHSTWTEALAKPLIVTMESTVYPIENIDFPGVALCNINRISKRAAMEDANEIMKPNFPGYTVEQLESFVVQLGRLIDFEAPHTEELKTFINHIPENFFNSEKLVSRMKKLAPSCERMLLRCTWEGHLKPCNELFVVRRTAHGHCCCFNYLMHYKHSQHRSSYRQVIPGFHYGLNVVVDPELDDYAYPLDKIHGIDVLLFDPDHYADHNSGLMLHRIAEPNRAFMLELNSREQIATNEIRKYSLETRNCLFKDERPNEFGDTYSFSACINMCRIKTINSLCKCTPFFLPVWTNDTPTCNFADLYCLNKYKEKFLYLYPQNPISEDGLELEMQDSLFCPECLPDCEYTRHSTRVSKVHIRTNVKKELAYNLETGMNLTNTCFISIFHASRDGILDRLDVVSYWYELLSNFGGAAGLLIGYSIISTIEILYYIIVRFVQIFHKKLS